MKTFKKFQARQIVRLLQFGGLAVALIVTMSQTSQAQLVTADQIIITDPIPEVLFRDNDAATAFNWEVEGYSEHFEIAEEGANNEDGIFKIYPNAIEDLLTLRGSSVIIGDQETTSASSTTGLTVTGTAFNAGIEISPDSDAQVLLRAFPLTNSFQVTARGNAASSSLSNMFRMSLDAPASSLTMDGNGDIGMGTDDPDSALHVLGTEGTARLLVEEINATAADRSLMRLMNNGSSRLEMTNTDSGRTWSLVADFNNQFQIRQNGPNTANFAIRGDGTFSFNNLGQSVMALRPNGNLRIAGVLSQGSDRNSKENIERVDASEVLAKVIDLPVSKWNYKADESDSSHVGPMAQDFHAAFGLGDDDKRIATLDTSGVALAAIQGLNEKLKSEKEELQTRIERLEKMVEAISAK